MGTSKRILILTAGFGEGHNAAARALAAAFDRASGPGTAIVVDPFAVASPRSNAVLRRVYLRLINDAPRLWSSFYGWLGQPNFVERRMGFFRRELRIIEQLIAREKPAAICCTYPLYAFFLNRIARTGRVAVPAVFNIVTDSISIHPLWWGAPCEGWFLPNEDSATVMRNAGVEPTALHVCGFPVPAFFAEQASTLAPTDLAMGVRPQVLHIINSGTLHVEATARRLLFETDWQVTFAVGRDRRLQRKLSWLAEGRPYPATVLGWTDRIPHLLMTSHAVVSKAGGATTQEAIAALCPMIVSQIVPGQEEGNYELLRRHNAGALALTDDAVLRELRRAFADRGRVWRSWRESLRTLANPNAAHDIAQHVMRASPGSRRPPPASSASCASAAITPAAVQL